MERMRDMSTSPKTHHESSASLHRTRTSQRATTSTSPSHGFPSNNKSPLDLYLGHGTLPGYRTWVIKINYIVNIWCFPIAT